METTTNCGRTLTLALLTCVFILAPISQALGQACIPPPSGLVGWWPLDETEGTIATDIVNGHDGVHVNNPTPEPGMVGGALAFHGVPASSGVPGTGDSVKVADDPAWAFGDGDFTIGGWVKVDNRTGIYMLVTQATNKGSRMHLCYGGDGRGLGFALVFPFPTLDFSLNEGNIGGWTAGVYRHFGFVRQGNLWALYVDGQVVSSKTGDDTYTDFERDLMFGFQEFGSKFYLDGTLDEIEIYDRALSGTALQAIFAAGSAGKCRGGVSIDIKPGTASNSINLKSKGVIPVAILSDADFSAITEIDISTLRFGPEGAESQDGASAAHKGHADDVNGDGYLDAVIHFPIQDTGIEPEDTVACVTGTTAAAAPEDVKPIEGCDDIRITPGIGRGR